MKSKLKPDRQHVRTTHALFLFDTSLRLAPRARSLTVDASRAKRNLGISCTANQADLSTADISRT
jgi:hypothetical protein